MTNILKNETKETIIIKWITTTTKTPNKYFHLERAQYPRIESEAKYYPDEKGEKNPTQSNSKSKKSDRRLWNSLTNVYMDDNFFKGILM